MKWYFHLIKFNTFFSVIWAPAQFDLPVLICNPGATLDASLQMSQVEQFK